MDAEVAWLAGREVHATTAQFPGFRPEDAAAELAAGVSEPGLGTVSVRQMQICPQNPGQLTEARIERLQEMLPGCAFRLHANARVLERHHIEDASSFGRSTMEYFVALAGVSRRLGATGYSLHAGRRDKATLKEMAVNVERVQDLFGIPVAVEGLYPRHGQWLIESWAEYAWLFEQTSLNYALDLSHLKIVATKEGIWPDDLISEMLASPRCIEIHLSDNDGRADQHRKVQDGTDWMPSLAGANPHAVIFTEGAQRTPHGVRE